MLVCAMHSIFIGCRCMTMHSICPLLQDLFGDGLLSSYPAPASKAGMYGQQRGQTGGYQQAQPQAQPSFQYGQPTGYGQPPGYGQPTAYGQPPSGYPQSQPVRPSGLPHGTSFSGYGVPPSGPPPSGPPSSTGLAFDGPVRQRTHSDNSATGQPTNSQVSCTSLASSAKEFDIVMVGFGRVIYQSDMLPWMAHSLTNVSPVSSLCSKLCLGK